MTRVEDYSDEMLIDYIRHKNSELYGEIIKRFQDKLMRYATYLTQDEQLAIDVVQEAFIKAYVNLNSFDIKKKFSSWIYRIVHNQAMNMVKKRKKEMGIEDGVEFDSGVDIEKEYERKEIQKMTKDCLEKMPMKYKEPLSLYFLEEKSYEEISDILRMSIGTVGTRIHRAKILMRKICEKKKK
jgi:RNA polymerase sigma-70 factor (ECF subfamily)